MVRDNFFDSSVFNFFFDAFFFKEAIKRTSDVCIHQFPLNGFVFRFCGVLQDQNLVQAFFVISL